MGDDWRSPYEYPNCTTAGWKCLWDPIWNRTNHRHSKDITNSILDDSYLSHGILPNESSSGYFDTLYYGPQATVEAPKWFHPSSDFNTIDIIPHWERQYGRFWIRAQMAHFIWQHKGERLRAEIQARTPSLLSQNIDFIGMHVRYSDNIEDLELDFGRNAT